MRYFSGNAAYRKGTRLSYQNCSLYLKDNVIGRSAKLWQAHQERHFRVFSGTQTGTSENDTEL